MARKKKITTVEEIPDDAMDEFAELAGDELPPDVEQMLEEIGEGATRCVIERRRKGENKRSYVGTIDAAEFSLEEVANRFGGGSFLVRFIGPGGVKKGATFAIDEARKPREDGGAAASPLGNGVTGSLLERLLERAMAPAPPQKDPMEIAAAIATAQAEQMKNSLALITPFLDKMLAGQGSGEKGTDAAGILSAVELGISLGGKDEGGVIPVLRDVGVPLVRALESHFANRAAPGAPAAPPSPDGGFQPVPWKNEPEWVGAVRPYVGKFVEFARRDDDPATWASVVDVQFPQFAEWLEGAAVNPNFEKGFLRYFPEFVPHVEWLRKFLDEFLPEDEPQAGQPAPSIPQMVQTDEEPLEDEPTM